MTHIASQLLNDEAGFIVSAELVLVATILVLGMIVGLSEVAHNINQELEDVGSAFGAANQSYEFAGFTGHKGRKAGSEFGDARDYCDGQHDITCDGGATPESPYGHGY